MRVLVTGGAGYIGSHTVVQLIEAGHVPVVLDNFSNAKPTVPARIEQITRREVEVYHADLLKPDALHEVFEGDVFDAVIHFAALKSVSESTRNPLRYYDSNVRGALNLLEAMRAHGPKRLVFSSSATVYGSDSAPPHIENAPLSATNPYGWTKVFIEQILRDLAASDAEWRIGVLRYFNPVGAHPTALLGEDPTTTPTNLMPIVARVAAGELDQLQIFGSDYDTVDGTGVRDYIHVQDLAAGHLAALDRLDAFQQMVGTWNLGTGNGTSVLQLVHAFEKASGRIVPIAFVDRRPGDVAVSVADPSRANRELSWSATRSIEDMCTDAWRWRSGHASRR